MKEKPPLYVPLLLTMTLIVVIWITYFHTDVVEASFGIVRNDYFIPTNRIPNRIGVEYAWSLKIHSTKTKVRVKEIFKLPGSAPWTDHASPVEWMETTSRNISKSGDVSVRECDLQMEQAEAMGLVDMNTFEYMQPYVVIKGDPSGEYRISIFVDGKFIKEFVFQVSGE